MPIRASTEAVVDASEADESARRAALLWLLTVFAALVLDWGSLALSRVPGQVASIWPGDAAVLVMMLAYGGRWAWARFAAGALGAFAAEALWGDQTPVSLGLVASNFLGIAIVFTGLGLHGRLDLRRTIHVLRFLALAALGAMVSGLAAGMVLRVLWRADFGAVWTIWVLGDWLGYAAIAPPLLMLISRRPSEAGVRVSAREAVLVLGAYTALIALVFAQTRYPLLFLAPLGLFAVAYLVELDGVMIAILITIIVGTGFSMAGRGPGVLVQGTASERLIVLQFFLASIAFAFLPISAIMTERRRLEGDLREARAAAEAASAMKSEFLADISHELRTPLASVLGFAGMLRDNAHLSAEDRESADSIAVAGSALLSTANDMLAFSELEAGRLDIQADAVNAGHIAEEVVRLFQAGAAAKGLAMTVTVSERTPSAVLIDRGRVRQVLLNLLANAVKFTDAGSVAVTVDYEGGLLRLAVEDTGPGLAADRLPYLFDRFSRADAVQRRRHGGTGLGLAICKGLVEAMDGTIAAHSVLGQGTTVAFAIPAPIPAARTSAG